MKPFNLEEAKAGKAVVTKDGLPVKIIYWDKKDENYPIVALVGEHEITETYGLSGNYSTYKNSMDLFMASEKKEGWINIYKYDTLADRRGNYIFPTKEEAIKEGTPDYDYITTTKIEWEE